MSFDEHDDQTPDAQQMAGELMDQFLAHDQAGLAALSPDGRAHQVAAREELLNYIEALWEGAKDRGLNPAILADWSAVAGMLDLAKFLWHNANEAAGDD